MNAALVLIISIVILLCGYVFYGKWLAEQWGIDPNKKTPAHEMEDGVDYVPAKTPVLMGHHFSSIAGAGPINGSDGYLYFSGFLSEVSSSVVFMITVHFSHLCVIRVSPSVRLSRMPWEILLRRYSLSLVI